MTFNDLCGLCSRPLSLSNVVYVKWVAYLPSSQAQWTLVVVVPQQITNYFTPLGEISARLAPCDIKGAGGGAGACLDVQYHAAPRQGVKVGAGSRDECPNWPHYHHAGHGRAWPGTAGH